MICGSWNLPLVNIPLHFPRVKILHKDNDRISKGRPTVEIHLKFSIFTDRIRSMGEGNIFTGVCLSTGGSTSRRHPPPPHFDALPPPNQGRHPYPLARRQTVNRRSARFLLEYILEVFYSKIIPSIFFSLILGSQGN